MEKSTPVIKVDTVDNWKKAKNYIPDVFTIIVMTRDGGAPIVKIGDGIHNVNDLEALNKSDKKEIRDNVLIL